MGFSRQEYWSGLSCPPPGDIPNPAIEPKSPATLAFQSDSLHAEPLEKPDLQDILELSPKKDILFIIGYSNAEVGSQEIPGITGKFDLEVQNEAGQRLTKFYQENTLVIATSSSNNTREDSIHGHHQMVNNEITLIIFFAAKDGETLYSQQKQDWELTVAQIMNSLLQNSDLI